MKSPEEDQAEMMAFARDSALIGARQAAKAAVDAMFEIGRREHEPNDLASLITALNTELIKAQNFLFKGISLCEWVQKDRNENK